MGWKQSIKVAWKIDIPQYLGWGLVMSKANTIMQKFRKENKISITHEPRWRATAFNSFQLQATDHQSIREITILTNQFQFWKFSFSMLFLFRYPVVLVRNHEATEEQHSACSNVINTNVNVNSGMRTIHLWCLQEKGIGRRGLEFCYVFVDSIVFQQ